MVGNSCSTRIHSLEPCRHHGLYEPRECRVLRGWVADKMLSAVGALEAAENDEATERSRILLGMAPRLVAVAPVCRKIMVPFTSVVP